VLLEDGLNQLVAAAMVDSMPAEQVKYMTDKIPMKRCVCDLGVTFVSFMYYPAGVVPLRRLLRLPPSSSARSHPSTLAFALT
jgi:hypothetical protein